MPADTSPASPPSRRRRVLRWIKDYSFYPTIVLLLVLFVFVLASKRIVYNIGSGERGVRWSRFGGGTVLDQVYGEGIRLIVPWDHLYIYNVRVQEIHNTATALTSNGLPITIRYSSRYHPDPARVPLLHQQLGPAYVDALVKPEVLSAIRRVVGQYRPEQIYSRAEEGLLREIRATLAANLTSHYVLVDAVLIEELRLPDMVLTAINTKLIQEQNALAYEYRLQAEKAEQERKTIEAEGIRSFEERSHISILQWRGLEVTEKLAASPNTKVVVVGTGQNQLPIILGGQ
jgi:regulator of protease activity HflC (stomatin/prohibitin superfamily)